MPELSTVAMAVLAMLQVGVEVVPDTFIWNSGQVLVRVKSSRFRLREPELEPEGVAEGAAVGVVEGAAEGVTALAGASKLQRTMQDCEIWVPVRVAVMVALLTPLDLPMAVTVPFSSTLTTSGLLLLQVT